MKKGVLASVLYATTVFRGPTAYSLLTDDDFVIKWKALFRRCPHATAFQAPGFVSAWYRAYRDVWEPVIVETQDMQGTFTGLWLLAYNSESGILVHAGAHQAEYHAWLAAPGDDIQFLLSAWPKLISAVRFAQLRCKYLPAIYLADVLRTALGHNIGLRIRQHSRPLLRLEADEIRTTIAKKGNRSRFNRLKKMGKLEFRRITDTAELEPIFDELIDFYDFRQGAVNNSTPFRDDVYKRGFHLDLLSAASSDLLVTATLLDERPIAAFWGMASGPVVHLGMLIHSPFLAEHSPGKLHIMQLSEFLLQEGNTTILDLTPGGDAWKERFANEHDVVAEAVLYVSPWAARMDTVLEKAVLRGKQWLSVIGITPDKIRRLWESGKLHISRNMTAVSARFHPALSKPKAVRLGRNF